MLFSETIKETIEIFLKFDLYIPWKRQLRPVESSGGKCSALRCPCLPPSAVTVLLHYLPRCLPSTDTCSKTPTIVTWSEH